MKSGLGGLGGGTAAAFDEDPSPRDGSPAPARAPRCAEGPPSISRNSSARRTDSGVVTVSPDPPRPLVLVATGSCAALTELSSALGEWGLRTAELLGAELEFAGLESAALGDPRADAVILFEPPTVTEAGAICRRLRTVGVVVPVIVVEAVATEEDLDQLVSSGATAIWRSALGRRGLARQTFALVRETRGNVQELVPKLTVAQLRKLQPNLDRAGFDLVCELNRTSPGSVKQPRLASLITSRAFDPERALATHVSRARKPLANLGIAIRWDAKAEGYRFAWLEQASDDNGGDHPPPQRRGRPKNGEPDPRR